jgi:antitoxin PrlF
MPAILTYRFSQDTRASKPPMNKRLPPADAARQCCTVLQDRQVFRVGSDEGSNLMRRQPLNARDSWCAETSPLNVPWMLSNTSNRSGITEEAIITVTVTSKGQVTVPKQVRDRLGIKPGSKVDFEVAEDGRAFLRRVGKRTVKPSRFERMRGTATSGLTTDAIMALSRGESR